MVKISIIGAGNMGIAIASRIKNKYKVIISDINKRQVRPAKAKGLKTAHDNIEAVKLSDIILIAVKPQQAKDLLLEIRPDVQGKLVVSIAAGVSTGFIEKVLCGSRVIRVMPNMPLISGEGISAITRGKSANSKDMKNCMAIFANFGKVIEVKENLMDVITAISGSGPAYYYLFTCLLETAGRQNGLSSKMAEKLARATFIGSAKLSESFNLPMNVFIDKIASKGGTTEAALAVFKKKNLEKIVKEAVDAAVKRAGELGRQYS